MQSFFRHFPVLTTKIFALFADGTKHFCSSTTFQNVPTKLHPRSFSELQFAAFLFQAVEVRNHPRIWTVLVVDVWIGVKVASGNGNFDSILILEYYKVGRFFLCWRR